MNDLTRQMEELLSRQKKRWKLVADQYAALENVRIRTFPEEGREVVLQFNPGRIRSSAAKIDAASLQARPCFFCHRPDEQEAIAYNADFNILVNPYPIFSRHFTIPLCRHERQQIAPYFGDFFDLAFRLDGYALFYNGPKCGASAPDHMHFQAAEADAFPLIPYVNHIKKEMLLKYSDAQLSSPVQAVPPVLLLISENRQEAVSLFNRLYCCMEQKSDEYEPMMNLLAWREGDRVITAVFPRRALRPSCYYAEGEANLLISPATVEMAGWVIVPREQDFERVTYADLKKVWQEVGISEEQKDRLIRILKEEE